MPNLEAYVFGRDFTFAQRVVVQSGEDLVRKVWDVVAEIVETSKIPLPDGVMPVSRQPEDFDILWPKNNEEISAQ